MTVCKTSALDLKALQEIENSSFSSDHISARQMRYHLKNPRAIFLVSKENNKATGYILALTHVQGYARIYSLAVSSDHRGKGYGRMLINSAIKKIEEKNIVKINLEVDQADAKTISLYQSFGFEYVSVLPKYYADGRTAIKMSKVLNG